jgi:hypothetical protein
MMNLKVYERKQSWPVSRLLSQYLPGGIRKHGNFNQDSLFLDRDYKREPPDDKEGLLST